MLVPSAQTASGLVSVARRQSMSQSPTYAPGLPAQAQNHPTPPSGRKGCPQRTRHFQAPLLPDAQMDNADPLLGHGRYATRRFLSLSDHAQLVEATDSEHSGEVVVVKVFPTAGATLPRVAPIVTNHPHVLRLREVFEFRGGLGVAMELADRGNMREFMTSRGGDALDEVTARFYFQQLLLAVDYVHASGPQAADMGLKLENLLLFKSVEPDADYPVLRVANQLGMAVNGEPGDRARCVGRGLARGGDQTAPAVGLAFFWFVSPCVAAGRTSGPQAPPPGCRGISSRWHREARHGAEGARRTM